MWSNFCVLCTTESQRYGREGRGPQSGAQVVSCPITPMGIPVPLFPYGDRQECSPLGMVMADVVLYRRSIDSITSIWLRIAADRDAFDLAAPPPLLPYPNYSPSDKALEDYWLSPPPLFASKWSDDKLTVSWQWAATWSSLSNPIRPSAISLQYAEVQMSLTKESPNSPKRAADSANDSSRFHLLCNPILHIITLLPVTRCLRWTAIKARGVQNCFPCTDTEESFTAWNFRLKSITSTTKQNRLLTEHCWLWYKPWQKPSPSTAVLKLWNQIKRTGLRIQLTLLCCSHNHTYFVHFPSTIQPRLEKKTFYTSILSSLPTFPFPPIPSCQLLTPPATGFDPMFVPLEHDLVSFRGWYKFRTGTLLSPSARS